MYKVIIINIITKTIKNIYKSHTVVITIEISTIIFIIQLFNYCWSLFSVYLYVFFMTFSKGFLENTYIKLFTQSFA